MSEVDHWALRRTLVKTAGDDPRQPLAARGFASWIQQDQPVRFLLLKELATQAVTMAEPVESNDVALLGYASSVDAAFAPGFLAGVARLSSRQYFVAGRPPVFEVNGLALFGVACGLYSHCVSHAVEVAWLKDLLTKSLQPRRPNDWSEALIAAAAEILGDRSAAERIPDDLRVALAARGALEVTQAARASAWTYIAGLEGSGDGMTRAAAQVATLSLLVRESSTLRTGTNSAADVANVLSNVSRSMRRWTWEGSPRTPKSAVARWVIDNEYHVQDMLWVILAPMFPDLDDEEWLKSLGQHKPRADLAIPSLRLIIEVKFARKRGKSFSELIQEVAADASTYLSEGGGYNTLIAFVWDDAARTEEHSELRQGLMRIRGVADAIVLPRPARMDRSIPVLG